MKVLAVDDSKTSLMLIAASLKKLGHEVIAIQDPRLAVDCFKKENPDLVILDVVMGEKGGYQCAREIRAINTEDDWVPIIFLSGEVGDDSIAKGIEAGGDDYLTKPFSEVTLKAKIHAMQRIANMRKKLYVTAERLNAANQRLFELSHIDELTGVANRRAFDEELEEEWRRLCRLEGKNKLISLLMIDIDHFKFYNDAYGHPEGDKCLKKVADILQKNLHRTIDKIYRYGGEEFVVLLPHTNNKEASFMAERLRKSVEDLKLPNIPSKETGGIVTISVGATTGEAEVGLSYDRLISSADMALYEVKKNGRNQVASKES
jgi:diguanylate cyclase (GGDEF)-like protein